MAGHAQPELRCGLGEYIAKIPGAFGTDRTGDNPHPAPHPPAGGFGDRHRDPGIAAPAQTPPLEWCGLTAVIPHPIPICIKQHPEF